ncbi:3609_t:CDS:2, partial [Diversispora eburnea]
VCYDKYDENNPELKTIVDKTNPNNSLDNNIQSAKIQRNTSFSSQASSSSAQTS